MLKEKRQWGWGKTVMQEMASATLFARIIFLAMEIARSVSANQNVRPWLMRPFFMLQNFPKKENPILQRTMTRSVHVSFEHVVFKRNVKN